MEFLTSTQIADFNNPLAFARTRTAQVGQNATRTSTSNTIRTNDIESSYRLVLGAEKRLETLEGNLATMLDLASRGARARGDERKINEFYGKIRSLSAGFDQVVEAIQFNKEAIFTDRSIKLDLGPGVRDFSIDPIQLKTYGENSLNLSASAASADIDIDYFTDDQIINSGYDIIGLDLTGATYISGSNPALELETGNYKVDIEYAGENSIVNIKTREGELIERREAVDLSGSGTEWVDFDAGFRLSFEKENLFQTFDKYDFEANGPAKLSASMSYQRIDRHIVRTDENSIAAEEAKFLFNSPFQLGETSISAYDPEISPVSPDKRQLDSGNYNIEIEYQGANSVIRMTDSSGRLKSYKYGVDLSSQGPQKIDMENGLSFTFDNQSFNTLGSKFSTALRYTKEEDPIKQFDFRAYQRRIEDAITIIQEQRDVILKAKSRIEEVNQLRNSASTSTSPNAVALNAGTAASILSGGGGIGIFASVNPSARFGILSTQLFQTTTALPSQANQSPEALAQISKTGSSASILSTFL